MMRSEREADYTDAPQAIGSAIYKTVTDPATELISSYIGPNNDGGLIIFEAGMLYSMTGNPTWLAPFSTDQQAELQRLALKRMPYITEVVSQYNTGSLPGFKSEDHLRERTEGLFLAAIDDSVLWYSLIERLEGEKSAKELAEHPTLAAATSLINTTHQVVKRTVTARVANGYPIELPKSRADFLSVFAQAPMLLAEMGLILEIEVAPGVDLYGRGICPAATYDMERQQSWHKALQQAVSQFYVRHRHGATRL